MGQIDTIKVDGTNYDVADKRLTECAVASNGKFFLAASDSNNPEISRMSHEDAAKVMSAQESLAGANDNVFILYYRKSDALLSMMEIEYWTTHQNNGEVATGVAVVAGERILVVAPTETSAYWSSAVVSAGGKTTSDRLTALGDFDGKANTASQITHAECSGASYAAGFCAQYSRVNANGQGLTAGSWWLPSIGELMMIYANRDKINYALSFISGATTISTNWYWSSTEIKENTAWAFYFSGGSTGNWFVKNQSQNTVRPVSSISLNLPSFYKDYENFGELADDMGGYRHVRDISSTENMDDIKQTGEYHIITEQHPSNMPSGIDYRSSTKCFVNSKGNITIQELYPLAGEPYYRLYYNNSDTWYDWTPLSTGIPSFYKDYPDIASLSKGVGGLINPDIAVKIDFDKMLTGGVYAFNTADNSPFSGTNGGYGMLIVIQGVSNSLLQKRIVQIAISLSGETKLRAYDESEGFRDWKTISLS